MSKELEALDKIRNHLQVLYMSSNNEESISDELDTIETALKRLNMYENIVGIEKIQDTNKKLKAFEIIKKVIQHDIKVNGNANIPEYEPNDVITKEEYDLLKEVLL